MNEKLTNQTTAENEKLFPAAEFLEEILPLLNDYFKGDFILVNGEVRCTFLNGQKIKLTAEVI